MASELSKLATRFCKALGDDTARQPRQWRPIVVIGVRCRIRAPGELQRIVAHAVKSGWLAVDDNRKASLTDEGRKL